MTRADAAVAASPEDAVRSSPLGRPLGFWRERSDGVIEVAGYLAINPTRASIAAQGQQSRLRVERHRAKARVGADHIDAETTGNALRHGRLPNQLPSPSPGESEILSSSESWTDVDSHDGGCAPARSRVVALKHGERTSLLAKERGKGSAPADSRRRLPFLPPLDDDAWLGVVESWNRRGLADPPSTAQCRRLWPVVVDYPDEVCVWVEEAPIDGPSSYGVVEHVLEAYRRAQDSDRRRDEFSRLGAEERDRWLELERSWPWRAMNLARNAREDGQGLPDVGPDENRFSAALPAMEARRAELEVTFHSMRQQAEDDHANGIIDF